MLSAEHILSCHIRFIFCGRDPSSKMLFFTSLYCCLHLVHLALHTAWNTSPETLQSSLVWISNGQLSDQHFCYRWGNWELWSWVAFLNNFRYLLFVFFPSTSSHPDIWVKDRAYDCSIAMLTTWPYGYVLKFLLIWHQNTVNPRHVYNIFTRLMNREAICRITDSKQR